MRTGANLDTSDPASQANVKALDAQIFKDIGKGTTVGSLVTPVGVPGAVLAIVGWLAAGGEVITSDSPLAEARDQTVEAFSEKGGEKVLKDVLLHSPAASARVTAIVELGGGWDAFTNRVNSEILGIKSNEKTN